MNPYTVKADGYQTRKITAASEIAARNIFLHQAGWLSDMGGYGDMYHSLTVELEGEAYAE